MVPIYLCDDDPQIRAAIRRELEKEMLIKGYDMKVAAACAGPEELLANTLEGKRIVTYYGIVSGETIIGANIFKDFFAGIRDIIGGRSGSYEKVLREAKDIALKEMSEQAERMGANAVIAIDLDYESVGDTGSMLMVTASGTAVRYE